MKRFGIIALAALLVVAFSIPASAIENQFGGYWRTRFISQQKFTGDDTGAKDLVRTDTRTRLYYTAVFSENFKFVNKFEMDAVWGDEAPSSYGDIGADGVAVEVKNSYADFTVADMLRFRVGVQGTQHHRGFLFDDDYAGARLNVDFGMGDLGLHWIKAYEGGMGNNANDLDVDYYGVNFKLNLGDNMSLNPQLMYVYSKDGKGWGNDGGPGEFSAADKVNIAFLGLDYDADFDVFTLGFTGLYEFGTIDWQNIGGVYQGPFGPNVKDSDVNAYLLALNMGMDFGPIGAHAEGFYASGDDGKNSDYDGYWVPRGQSYYWAEIMGYGIFDQQVSAGSPGDQIGNIYAVNIGASFSAMENLSLGVDLWYASLVEKRTYPDGSRQDGLGFELDGKVTWGIMDNLNLDLVGAYLFADDATSLTGKNTEDPYELGARLSLSF